MVGRTMRLSRYVVAMPSYSSIVIDADISDSHGRLAGGSLEFQIGGQCKKLIDGEFGTIALIVRLETPYREFIPEVDIRQKDVGENNLNAMTEDSQVVSRNNTVQDSEKFGATVLAELFSVYVGGTNREVSAVCVKIYVRDAFNPKWNMFESDLDTPEFLSQGKGDYPINCDCLFNIDLSLIDPISIKELCNKTISYSYISITQRRYGVPSNTDAPPNKRYCSFIKEGHGYVLLQYIIFDNACQAIVEIKFLSDHPSSLPVKICGSVMASYSNHNYSTMYEKKYYRSRLDKPQTEFVQLDSDLSLPLSKSLVVVPEGASLVIEVDLETLSSGNLKDIVFEKKELRINSSRTVCEAIVGKYYGVQISAKFKDCDGLLRLFPSRINNN